MAKAPLTLLLGAGSTLNLGLPGHPSGMPSTKELTDALRHMRYPMAITHGTPILLSETDQRPTVDQAAIPIIGHIFRMLESSFDQVDFELVLHALEQLDPLVRAQTIRDMHDQFRPVLHAFTRLKRKSAFLREVSFLSQVRRMIVLELMRAIRERTQLIGNSPAPSLSGLISRLEEDFSISVFTLNYDDMIDRARQEWFDGFADRVTGAPGYAPREAYGFDTRAFLHQRPDAPLLVHLHGSVRFGYLADGRFNAGKSPFSLVRYADPDTAYRSIEGTASSDHSSGGQIVSASPVISGLSKVAKLMSNPIPFGYYYKSFIDTLLQTPRLLVIGYGGRDDHLNTWLEEFVTQHGDQRRVIYVSKLSGETAFARTPERDIMSMLGGSRDVQHIYDDAEAERLQKCGALGVVASGFPMDPSILDHVVTFLKTEHCGLN